MKQTLTQSSQNKKDKQDKENDKKRDQESDDEKNSPTNTTDSNMLDVVPDKTSFHITIMRLREPIFLKTLKYEGSKDNLTPDIVRKLWNNVENVYSHDGSINFDSKNEADTWPSYLHSHRNGITLAVTLMVDVSAEKIFQNLLNFWFLSKNSHYRFADAFCGMVIH